jgi:hypothetical protein
MDERESAVSHRCRHGILKSKITPADSSSYFWTQSLGDKMLRKKFENVK